MHQPLPSFWQPLVRRLSPATRLRRSYAMSGSTTPVSSAASYSDADVRAQSVWQAEVNKLKVAQLDELLSKKGVKPRGVKAEKAMEVAWRYTKEEIAEWRAKQEELTSPALLSTPRRSQPTLKDFFNAK